MAKKQRKPQTAKKASTKELSLAQAVKLHADAIHQLSEALANRATMSAAGGAPAVATLSKLSRSQIVAELARIWGASSVKETDDINKFFDGGPGAVVAFWEPLCNWPAFEERHLHLGPNDLRFVTTVGELVSVIDWGLRSARR
jgi:hypothetical protein